MTEKPFLNNGNVPILHVVGKTVPEAWQNAMLELWHKGIDVPTSFDNPGDPPSKDATVTIEVTEPLLEPRIHKYFPASIEGLEHYRLEVTHGVHDHWIERFGTKWNYTYHERLRAWDKGDGQKVDQLERLMEKIAKKAKAGSDLTNRRFQVTTWIPGVDDEILDPPCLQRLHFRLIPNEKEGYGLNLNTDWRSRDGYLAWVMNVFALTELQRLVADELTDRCDIPIEVGRYFDKSDSLHVYGKNFKGVGGFESFVERATKQSLEGLVLPPEKVGPLLVEARHLLAAQLDYEKVSGQKALIDPKLDEMEVRKSYAYPKEWDK